MSQDLMRYAARMDIRKMGAIMPRRMAHIAQGAPLRFHIPGFGSHDFISSHSFGMSVLYNNGDRRVNVANA